MTEGGTSARSRSERAGDGPGAIGRSREVLQRLEGAWSFFALFVLLVLGVVVGLA
jgi:hypothetical protein